MSSNHIKNIAIIGAGGNSGKWMVTELLKTGKHTVTALTRAGSSSSIPDGVQSKTVDYDDASTLVAALRGQDALIITLSVTTPHDTQPKIIQAAADAGVPWILPNEWAPDSAHDGLAQDVFSFGALRGVHKQIIDLGKSSFVAVTCSFWYEWSLAIAPAFGFDTKARKATFFDNGTQKILTSTWPQVGRGVAALLSLPIKAEAGNDEKKSLEHFRNKHVYLSSFLVSQEDMLESILRVTGDRREDWTIEHQDSKERWAGGIAAMKAGDRTGFVHMMYTRVFFPDGAGDYSAKLDNDVLGLPKENLDEATAVALERAKTFKFGQ